MLYLGDGRTLVKCLALGPSKARDFFGQLKYIVVRFGYRPSIPFILSTGTRSCIVPTHDSPNEIGSRRHPMLGLPEGVDMVFFPASWMSGGILGTVCAPEAADTPYCGRHEPRWVSLELRVWHWCSGENRVRNRWPWPQQRICRAFGIRICKEGSWIVCQSKRAI